MIPAAARTGADWTATPPRPDNRRNTYVRHRTTFFPVGPSNGILVTMSPKSASSPPLYLGEFELLILLAVLRLDADAYGVTIKDALDGETSRDVTLGAIYKTLGRLEAKGFVSTRLGEPTPQRGGKRKKLYRLEPLGHRALKQSIADLRRLARGLGRALEAL